MAVPRRGWPNCTGLALLATWACMQVSADEEPMLSPDGRPLQTMMMDPPKMDEEEQHSTIMPEKYRCDACKAIMFHLDGELRKVHPKSRRMKQWEYTDVFDRTCREAFKDYGIKVVNNENMLAGPALQRHGDGAGAVILGNNIWNMRMIETCRKLVYEKSGEEELYDKFWGKFQAEVQGEASDEIGLSGALCAADLGECKASKSREKADRSESKKSKKSKKDKKDKKKKASKDAKSEL